MLKVILRFANLVVLTLLVLSFFSFLLAYMFPGEPLANLTGVVRGNEQQLEALGQLYHLDNNFLVQYWYYLAELFDGNWGLSFSSGLPLASEIARTLPASIELSTYALILSMFIGLPLGFIAGLRHRKTTDYALLSLSVLGYSIPVFWLAMLMILGFCLQLGWFPLSGRLSLLYEVPRISGFILLDIMWSDLENKSAILIDALRHLILPTLSIAAFTTTIILRITRRSVIETMNSDYILAALARGLTPWQILFRHGIKNALMPILPLIALQFTTLLTNAMIVEVIFSWPGIGNWLIQAIYQRDYPAIRVGMLAVSTLVVLFTMSIDLLIRLVDPKKSKVERVAI
ncbi:ABC transporter permease [Paraglaciecola hydrolytica]|uniref:Peptide ABC transporter permease n=1 Tax=Paraglaciecola hydrolytica TaxID=1799789 RepID=A0A148KNT8_9ALTE|nr:ABC transporter permease [Paraglaciecola hydrolytica]KXI27967.1 peptide ABC transporter permease [Paraglaciecola hydrolytica]